MSDFFPAGFDPRDPVTGTLDLCLINTPDGPFRFLLGVDGLFTDIDGREWYGSALGRVSGMQSAIDGVAPAGSVTMSFFQDPDAPNLARQVRDLGQEYIAGRNIEFYIQPLQSYECLYAPKYPPILWMTRVMRQLRITANGAQDRSIGVTFETWAEFRNGARRMAYNTEDHSRLLGRDNPSLEFMPTSDFEEEKLFG